VAAVSGYLVSAEVDGLVERFFTVEDRFMDANTPNFIIAAGVIKGREARLRNAFRGVASGMRGLDWVPEFRWIVGRYYVTLHRREPPRASTGRRNKLLLTATVATVFLDGYIRSDNPVLTRALMPGVPPALNALIFTVGILIVFGVHELGHKFLSERRGFRSSWPYFIPAPPGLGGTFGAVISLEEQPTNRDDLFDLGLSGPVSGFLATLAVAVLGLFLSFTVTIDQVGSYLVAYPEIRFQNIPMPLALDYIANSVRPTPAGGALVLHPLAFAAWVGCLVTFINLIPSWQLDGGHVVRALFGGETHKVVSVAGIFLMLISGYVIMGVLIAFFMMGEGKESLAPLDDISPLDFKRKVFGTLFYVMLMGATLISLIQI